MIRRLIPSQIKQLRNRIRRLDKLDALDALADLPALRAQLDSALQALGRIESRQLEDRSGPLAAHEFRVYSHAGEDGIIQYLTSAIPQADRRLVEFGVEDYQEANTRFLMIKDGWSGLVFDGAPENIARIKADPLFWNSSLKAEVAFVTRENINELLVAAGFAGDIGLLSVDVDGNDYWIFDAITVASPAIAVVEYNYRFGPTRRVTIPYDPTYVRRREDWTWHFGGASLAAIVAAAKRKGMAFVGCNSFGNNAFFVRADLLPPDLEALTPEQGFVAGRFKEAIIENGQFVVPSPANEDRLRGEARLVEVS